MLARRLGAAVCVAAFVVRATQVVAQPIEVPDHRGTILRLATPATRIVSIAPHLTEIAYAAGAGARLVAVSAFSDHPPEARRLPQVGDGARVDIERILTLKPDLVLAWRSGNQAGDVARMERLGIKVWVSEASQLSDIPALLRNIALLAGTAADGERAARTFEQALADIRSRYATASLPYEPVRVFYEIWHQPLLTVNGAHLISDAIAACGGANVFARLPALTPSVTLEAVLAARPQLVLGGGSANGEADFERRWRGMPLMALRIIPARYIAPDTIQRQSPRILDGIRAMCAQIDGQRGATKGLSR